jgi:nitrogen fixation protein FixH
MMIMLLVLLLLMIIITIVLVSCKADRCFGGSVISITWVSGIGFG